MSTIDLKGISATLDKIDNGWEISGSFPQIRSFPQISIPAISTDILSGVSLSCERLSRPLEYKDDIFSELPVKAFDATYNKQMAKVMKAFRSSFTERLSKHSRDREIPKFLYSYDEEEKSELFRMTSQWDEGNAMLYFSFENDPHESNFGMLWNDNKYKNYQTRSGNLYLSDTDSVIHEAIDFIFRVYSV